MATADPAPRRRLDASAGALLDIYDGLLVDLDGVVYLGEDPIDGAGEALAAARTAGVRPIFVTNNASRPPGVVADQLAGMGVDATADDVMTSSIAAARMLAERLAPDSPVLAVGGPGVGEALRAAGLRPVDGADAEPAAVLQGFGPDVGWAQLAEAMVAIRAGAAWIATNTDVTLPSPRGPLPGNGALVAALAAATGQTPEVVGKPEPALFAAALAAISVRRPLVVGDRLDTDMAGAYAAGLPSLAVLTGVSSAADVVAAPPEQRPSYLGRDLRALAAMQPETVISDGRATCRGTTVGLDSGRAVLVRRGDRDGEAGDDGDAEADDAGLDGLRALCGLVWSSPAETAIHYDEILESLDVS
jgi:HAD superfamily hydrolase (TIGR01450 family)